MNSASPKFIPCHGELAEQLCARVCVRPPYFALQALSQRAPGELSAEVPIQLAPDRERTPITVAEAGRHLAILGLCAAASLAPDDKRRYYLARTARCRGLQIAPMRTAARLFGKATATLESRRRATAHSVLAAEDGTPIFGFDFAYDVMSARVFERLMSYARRPGAGVAAGDVNPYVALPVFQNVTDEHGTLSTTVLVRPEQCAGHFWDYPTLPVAILGGCMVNLASLIVDRVTGRPSSAWLTREMYITADRLAAAGELLTLTAALDNHVGTEVTVKARTLTEDGTEVSALEIRMALVDG